MASEEQARFHTLSGLLTAKRDGAWIEKDFPIELAAEAPAPPALPRDLDVTPTYVGQNRFDYLLEIETEAAVAKLQEDPMSSEYSVVRVRRKDNINYSFAVVPSDQVDSWLTQNFDEATHAEKRVWGGFADETVAASFKQLREAGK